MPGQRIASHEGAAVRLVQRSAHHVGASEMTGLLLHFVGYRHVDREQA